MSKVTLEQNLEYLAWVNDKVPWPVDPTNKTWITNLSNSGRILAVVFFYNWRAKGNIEVGLVTEKTGLTREFLVEIFRYCFFTLAVSRITVFVSKDLDPYGNWVGQLALLGGFVEVEELTDWFGKGKSASLIRFLPKDVRDGILGDVVFEGVNYEF